MRKNFSPVSVGTKEWLFTAFPAGKECIEIRSGNRVILSIGRAGCGNFEELSALPELFRLHRSEDGFSAELESSGTIPFGTEFKVGRKVALGSSCAAVMTTFKACNGGVVGNITLEPVAFPGPWAKVRYLLHGSSKLHTCKFREGAEFHCGPELPWFIQVEHHDGSLAEFITGSDLWRHLAAEKMENVTAEYRIADVSGTLVFERHVLRYGEEAVMEKRPWQFESLFSWSSPLPEKPASFTSVPIPGCLVSRNVQGLLRREVRSAQTPLVLTGYSGELCTDASHLERAAKKNLEHRDLNDLFQLYCWANRQLGRKGLSLTVDAGKSALPETAFLTALSRPPAPLLDEEDTQQ